MKHYCNYGILKIEDDSGNDGIRRILFLKNTFTIILLCHLILGSKAFDRGLFWKWWMIQN